jgi:hypothetical protein
MSVNITSDGKRTVVAEIEWLPRPDGLERAIVFQPGYNGDRTDNPRHDYGVHGMEITWYLRGPKGAVQVQFFTDWIPGPVYPGHGLSPSGFKETWSPQPTAAGLTYHCRVPQYEGQRPCRDECPIIGGLCYSDTGYSASDPIAEAFVIHGEPAVWAALEVRYQELGIPDGV